MENGKEKAMTILEQLGGNRFLAMTGARNITYDEDGTLAFFLPKKAKGINHIRIRIEPSDTYTVIFGYYSKRNLEYKPVKEVDMVYSDNLREVFTINTGLDCTLGTAGA